MDDSNAFELHGFEGRFKDAHGNLSGPHGFAKSVRACQGHSFRSVDTAVSLVGDLSPELFMSTFKCKLGLGENDKTLWHVTPYSNGLSILQMGVWAGGLLV